MIVSKYCYKDTETFINRFNIKDSKTLNQLEADLTQNRLLELHLKPMAGKFSFTHLKNIHQYIFQDIYYFAGKLREEDLVKGETSFCKYEYIQENIVEILLSLKSENYLLDYNLNLMVDRLAFYMAELNIIHPFREGNGRAIREFIRLLALKSHYMIDWSLVDHDELLEAMIRSVDRDYTLLAKCIAIGIE